MKGYREEQVSLWLMAAQSNDESLQRRTTRRHGIHFSKPKWQYIATFGPAT